MKICRKMNASKSWPSCLPEERYFTGHVPPRATIQPCTNALIGSLSPPLPTRKTCEINSDWVSLLSRSIPMKWALSLFIKQEKKIFKLGRSFGTRLQTSGIVQSKLIEAIHLLLVCCIYFKKKMISKDEITKQLPFETRASPRQRKWTNVTRQSSL